MTVIPIGKVGSCPFCTARRVRLSSGDRVYRMPDGRLDTIVPCCASCLPNAHALLLSHGAVVEEGRVER